MEEYEATSDVLDLTVDVVTAFLANNKISSEALPDLIKSTYGALSQIAAGTPESDAEPEVAKPTAAAIRKSISDDYLISFEDGKRYKSMKRSLSLRGLTPDDYRSKWGLPKDYPMVAPGYAAARSALAKSMGLGQGGRKPKAAVKSGVKARKA